MEEKQEVAVQAPRPDIRTAIPHITVRLECLLGGGQQSCGTGFFFHFDSPSRAQGLCVITNRHVVEGAERLTLCVTKSRDGSIAIGDHCTVRVRFGSESWIAHPDENIDLAAIPVNTRLFSKAFDGQVLYLNWLAPGNLPSQASLEAMVPGDDILMVGYPIGLWDDVNNLPLVRRGIVATSPSIDYRGTSQFVIDAACYPGSSGSPVLWYRPPVPIVGGDNVKVSNAAARAGLLGVLWGGPVHSVGGAIKARPIPTRSADVVSEIPAHLGFVVKAHNILAFRDAVIQASNAEQPRRA